MVLRRARKFKVNNLTQFQVTVNKPPKIEP